MRLTKGLKQFAVDFVQLLGKDKTPCGGRCRMQAPDENPACERFDANVSAPSSDSSSQAPYASLPNIPSLPIDYKVARDALSDDGTPMLSSSGAPRQMGSKRITVLAMNQSSMLHELTRGREGTDVTNRSTPLLQSTCNVAAASTAPTSADFFPEYETSENLICSLLYGARMMRLSVPESLAQTASSEDQRLTQQPLLTSAPIATGLSVTVNDFTSSCSLAKPDASLVASMTATSSVATRTAAAVAIVGIQTPPPCVGSANPPAVTVSSIPNSWEASIPAMKGSSERLPADAASEFGYLISTACSSFAVRPLPPVGQLYTSPSLPSGMCLGRGSWSACDFQINRKLHKGYSSSVYKAVCQRSGSEVVLKAYALTRLSAFLQNQVLRELHVHSGLQHPGVVQLLAAFREDGNLVMVQEFIRGGSLERVRRKLGGRMTEFQAMHLVLLPLLGVLRYLHERGIAHRDIKPDNILFTEHWKLKVCDFGVSICMRDERAVTRTGTREYYAPEVDLCPPKRMPEDNKDSTELGYSTAIDIWSLGAMMYELLVGFTPFPGGPPQRKNGVRCSAGEGLAFPSSVSASARAFVRDCLQLAPEDRPTVHQLLKHAWIREALMAAESLIIKN